MNSEASLPSLGMQEEVDDDSDSEEQRPADTVLNIGFETNGGDTIAYV